MGQQLVVEGEARFAVAQPPGCRRHGDVRRGRQPAFPGAQMRRQRNVQRLRHVGGGLGVHVLVEQREAVEVERFLSLGRAGEQAQRLGQAGGEVGARRGQVGQRQAPARRVLDQAGVVERVGAGQAAGGPVAVGIGREAQVALRIAREPEVVKPRDMSHFPQRRIELRRVGNGQRLAQPGDIGIEQLERALAGVLQGGSKRAAVAAATKTGNGIIGGHETILSK